jgi:hypothetical protein
LGVQIRATIDGPWSPPRVLELPLNAYAEIARSIPPSRPGGLSGVEFVVSRDGSRRSCVRIHDVVVGELAGEKLSREQVLAALCRLWQVPLCAAGQSVEDWRAALAAVIGSDDHYRRARP